MSKPAAATVLRGWDWAQHSLWTEDAKCSVRMADTVFFDATTGVPTRWLFASKQGTIAKKKDDHVLLMHIRDRFVKLSQHPRNTQKYVAHVLYRNGNRKLVNAREFDDLLTQLEALPSPKKHKTPPAVLGLQAHVVSREATQTALVATVKGGQCLVSAIQQSDGADAATDALSPRLRKEVEHATLEIIRFLHTTSHVAVSKITAEFVVDDEHLLWLVHIPNVVVASLPEENLSTVTNSSSVPALQLSQSLPSLNFEKAFTDGSVKCRGEFCRVQCSALPGYGCVVLLDCADAASSSPRLYPIAPSTPPLEDGGQRFKIGNNNVVLARLETRFMHTKYTDEMAAEWAAFDATQRADLGRTNPGHFYKLVNVCANCNRVYGNLQSLRQNDFRHAFDLGDERRLEAALAAAGEPKKTKQLKKKERTTKPSLTSNNFKPSGRALVDAEAMTWQVEELMRFMGVAKEAMAPSLESIQDQQHEAAFLAELARHSNNTPRTLDPLASPQGLPEDESTEAPSAAEKPKRGKRGKQAKDNQPVLAQFEQEWNEVDKANRTLLQENHELREKLQRVETEHNRETNRWQQELNTALETNTVLEKQSKQVGKRMAVMQMEFTDAMLEKDEIMRRRILETEQVCNQQLARITNQPGDKPKQEARSGDQLSLIETIEQLTAQLERDQRDHEQETHKLQATHQQDTARLFERHKMEAEALRMSVRQGVDAIEELKTQLFSCQNQLQVAQSQTKQAKVALADAQRQKLELEDQVQTLEKHTQAISSEAHSNAPSDAAMEKLNHKVEYLKAQLASEIRCKEELGSTVATLTANIDALKKDRKKVVMDADETHRKMQERVEERHKQEMEMVNTQNATLQSKLVQLQANVTDLVADLSIARNKEDNAKLTTEKLAQENARLNGRIAELELQIDELQDTVNGTKSSMEDANRANLEATLRRLTHERQYLKNQMEGETRCKEDAEAKVKELQSQLQELQTTWKADVAAVKGTTKEKEQSLLAQCAKAEESLLFVQGEFTSTKHQLNEAKLALFKAREQSHADQTALESNRADMAHMKASLISAKEELLKERERGRVASDRQTKAIQAVKASLVQLEEEKTSTLSTIQSELQTTLTKLAQAQATILQLEHATTVQSSLHRRALALQRVVVTTLGRQAQRAASRWWRWTAAVQTLRALQQQGAKMAETLKAREVMWQKRLQTTCDEVSQKGQLEKELALAELKATCDAALAAAVVACDAQRDAQLRALDDDLTKRREDAIEAMTSQHHDELETLETQHADTIHRLQQAARANEIQAEKTLLEAQAEAQAQLVQVRNDVNQSMTDTLRDMEVAHKDELQQRQADEALRLHDLQQTHAAAMAAAVAASSIERRERVQEAMEMGRMANLELEMRWHVASRRMLDALRQELDQTKRDATQALASEHAQDVADVVRHWTGLLSEERASHARALQDLRTALDIKVAADVESCRREMLEQKGSAVMATTAKWQRALADTNARLEVEKKVAYDRGVADREAEWQKAALLIKQAQKDEVATLELDSREALRACEEKFQLTLAAKTAELEQTYAIKLEAHVAAAKLELRQRIDETQAVVRATTTASIEDEWRAKCQSQKEALEAELQAACHEVEARMQQSCDASLKQGKEAWEARRQADLAKLQATLRDEFAAKSTSDKAASRRELEAQLQAVNDQWSAKWEAESDRLVRESALHLEEEIQACANAAAKQHEEQMALVQEESEKLIDKVESAMHQLKKQKESTEVELKSVQQALEEAEDASFDLQEELAGLKKQHVFHHIMLLHKGMRKMQHLEDEIDSKELERKAQVAEWQQKMDETTRVMNDKLNLAQQGNHQLERVYTDVYETLVNYKRDELVAHRSASNVVTSELGVLQAQIAQVMTTKSDGETEIQKALAELGTLEEEIGAIQLMKDGHVNQAQVARKRRLHQETETMLEMIESKRSRVRTIEAKLQELQGQQKCKEDEMKGLERQLVQILVEQQRQLLGLVTSVKTLGISWSAVGMIFVLVLYTRFVDKPYVQVLMDDPIAWPGLPSKNRANDTNVSACFDPSEDEATVLLILDDRV
ncbi:Aste57867_12848 [Aphanomyces stellatus]|uniref:Aste57867_12848 protein n=1 Tax=Aphanomyces stellatus TaxID=120398 RepID=A0A485KY87_9STRA|nr:hypothetical protein As57867_012800 [Aphanomyces stellatus]VFT89695.1 Aste57867_12848 [Aphanomyces stellatus]